MKGSLLTEGIAEPYAQALMSIAQSNNSAEQLGEEIKALNALLENSPELRGFLKNPTLDDQKKKAVLLQIIGEDASPYFINFLKLLVDKRRIFVLEEITEAYLALLRDMNQTVLAEVTSAAELSDAQKEAVENRVKEMTDAAQVELKTSVDPALIGGVIVKVGSQVLDASLKGQLRRIGLQLSSAT
ncbi:ATP synthase F1 subunit delta [Lusitaniella coriacea]|uniref:ATP synthase F1 subunit delta n=1 Tax=Lusitaniella coriacea TaxID=1983105 RepID=UPI003CEAC3BC